MNQPIAAARNLSVAFRTRQGRLQVLDRVNVEVRSGQTLGVVGESGSGKSVLARTFLGLTQEMPNSEVQGEIQILGRAMNAKDPVDWRAVRGKEVAMIFQDPMTSLNPVFTVGDQIRQVLRQHQGLTGQEAKNRAAELLAQVGIPDPMARLDEYPHRFSGGMRQRVVIAIALACRPKLLIADEPTTALDVTVQAQVIDLLRDLQKQLGMAMIFITHNLGLVREVCHELAVMYAGQIVEYGDVESVLQYPKMPYTRKLIESVPRMEGPIHARLASISGGPPRLDALPPGCRFQPRCDLAHAACQQPPQWTETGSGYGWRCWLANQHPNEHERVPG